MTLTCGQARAGAGTAGRRPRSDALFICRPVTSFPNTTIDLSLRLRRAAAPSLAGPGCLMPARLPASLYDPLPLAPVRVPDIASASRRSGAECGLAGASFSF